MLDNECIAALKEVADAETTSTPVNALMGRMTERPMELGHLLFEGYVQNDDAGNLSLTARGYVALRGSGK